MWNLPFVTYVKHVSLNMSFNEHSKRIVVKNIYIYILYSDHKMRARQTDWQRKLLSKFPVWKRISISLACRFVIFFDSSQIFKAFKYDRRCSRRGSSILNPSIYSAMTFRISLHQSPMRKLFDRSDSFSIYTYK